MLQEAIAKLQDEVEKSKEDTYVQVVGEFLIKYIELNPGQAEKIINTDKTIKKSLEAMKEAARKKKTGNYAVLTDQEGFEVVLEYFGINTKSATNITKPVNNLTEIAKKLTDKAKESKYKEVDNDIDFDIKLEDLL